MIAILVAVGQELNPILRLADARTIIRQEHLDFYEGTSPASRWHSWRWASAKTAPALPPK